MSAADDVGVLRKEFGEATVWRAYEFRGEHTVVVKLAALKEVLAQHEGPVPVQLRVHTPAGVRLYQLGDRFRVARRAGLFGEIKAAFGPDAVEDLPRERTFREDVSLVSR